MPNKNRRRRSGKRTSSSNTMALVVSSNRPTGSTTSFPREDLVFKRQNFNVVQSPPRKLSNQIYWSQFKYDQQFNVLSSGINESNLYFTATLFSSVSNFLAAFDQYCIHSIVVTFSSNISQTIPIRLWTAIDYDSVTNLGSLLGIQGLSTCAFHSIVGDTSGERLLYPCIAPQQTAGVTLVPGGIGRAWLDSAYPAIHHYGLRTMSQFGGTSATGGLEVTYTAIIGFRNST
jgi:hypothetical protein